MIKARCKLGLFSIMNGRFMDGNSTLKSLYGIAMIIPLQPDEGPVDYAIAARMMEHYKWVILEEDYPKEEDGIVY